MALIRMDIFSRCLMRTVPVTAIVPVDNVRYEGEPERPVDMPYKTLFLLNGLYGNNIDWVCASNIFEWAQERNLVVIMPAGENRFYVDNAATGEAYGRFIGEELVERMRRMFPLSRKREDTYICGLSMGGYGAIRNGLKYAHNFGYAAGLSAAFIKDMIINAPEEDRDYTQTRKYYESIYGDISQIDGSDMDCETLYLQQKQAGIELPKLYMAIGTEDFLLEPNRKYKDFLKAQDADFIYEEGPGEHNFKFWNEYLGHVLDWLPLEGKAAGISSGNVKR